VKDRALRIETARFLGSEFLLWLWFGRDATGGELFIPGHGLAIITFETQLALADPSAERERVSIRGADPCGGAEAAEALIVGKLPRKAGLRIEFESNEWTLTIDSHTLALSGVKLPAVDREGEEAQFYERMHLLEQLHELIHRLYALFLGVRLAPVWESEVVPALRRWVLEGALMDAREFERLHGSTRRSSRIVRGVAADRPKARRRHA
jgi:hypothetical protein